MRYEYREVWVNTLDGLKLAERLQRNGWEQVRVGLNMVTFRRKVPARKPVYQEPARV